jgi:hypothetical protein
MMPRAGIGSSRCRHRRLVGNRAMPELVRAPAVSAVRARRREVDGCMLRPLGDLGEGCLRKPRGVQVVVDVVMSLRQIDQLLTIGAELFRRGLLQ